MGTATEMLHQQFGTFLRIRWVGILILTGISLVAALVGGGTWLGLWPPLCLLGIVVGVSLPLQWGMRGWLLQYPKVLAALKWVLPALDLLVMTALCHFTGGILSLYVLMPVLYIVAAAPLLGSRPAYLGAAWTGSLYGIMVLLELEGILPHGQPIGSGRDYWTAVYDDPPMVIGLFLLIIGILYLGAHVGGTVADRLARQRDEITHLYEESQREARKMHLVNELSRSLSAILEWPTLLARVLTELKAVLPFDYAGLHLYDDETQQLRLVATRGFSDQEAREIEAFAMERHPGWVLRNRQSLLVPDTTMDPRIYYTDARRSLSVLMVPLLYQERCLGIMGLGSKEKDAFSVEEQELLEALAGQLAVALANAQLYQESHQMLEELRQAQEQLVRSGRMAAMGELTAGLAHELNNPLGIILGNVQLALEAPQLDPEVQRNLKIVETAAGRISRLMRILADLGALQEERFEAVHMEQLLEEALTHFSRQAEEERVAIERHYAPSLPCVWGSSVRLFQVLEQILQNALEAMSGQERPKRLVLATDCDEEEVVLSVRDTGRGIPADQQARVFEPGFTTKVEEGRSRGLGLGLFTAYYTVRAHGGDLTLTSHKGSGTELTIRLPAMAGQLE